MKWKFLNPDPKMVNILKEEFRSSEIIAQVLANRNIESLENSKPFFQPLLDELHDPFSMKDMEKAVNRIITNIESGKQIFIFGDYDVDGTTGAAMLYLTLTKMGGKVVPYIPNRESEGYGLSSIGIDKAHKGNIDLIITCDCGINAFGAIEYANSLGIDVVITDHHIPDDSLPEAYAILNPKRTDCEYPFKYLCGGGVAFKLASALAQTLSFDQNDINTYLDLVTLGTCADMVPIVDENRVIVRHGLNLLRNSSKPGIKALLQSVGLSDKTLSVGQLVFSVAPKINAAGRLGDANRSVELLTTNDLTRASSLSSELLEENHRRQQIQKEVVDDAFNKIHADIDLDSDRAIVLAGSEWHPGVIGLSGQVEDRVTDNDTSLISGSMGELVTSDNITGGKDVFLAGPQPSVDLDTLVVKVNAYSLQAEAFGIYGPAQCDQDL